MKTSIWTEKLLISFEITGKGEVYFTITIALLLETALLY